MGDCIYCGLPAGFLRRRHKECQQKAEAEAAERKAVIDLAEGNVRATAGAALAGQLPLEVLPEKLTNIIHGAGLDGQRARQLLISAWCETVDAALDNGLIDESEENRLAGYLNTLSIDREEVDADGHFGRMVKGALLNDLHAGRLPNRLNIIDRLPINLQAGEHIVWVWRNTRYLEDRVRRDRVGGSQGVSIRIMSGVYYRVGGFKSRPVDVAERIHVDTGMLIATDRNLYFAGPVKSTRIPYAKIVTFDPYSDGIGLTRDALTAKPQIFVTDDGWFTYNLVTNLAQRAVSR